MQASDQTKALLEQARMQLIERLDEKRAQIEAEILAHLRSIGAPQATSDATYEAGRHEAINAVLDYCLRAFAADVSDAPEPIPALLIEQVHRAARAGMGSETLAERLMAGSTLLGQHVVAEAKAADHPEWAELVCQLRDLQDEIHRRLAESVFTEYRAERERLARSEAERRLELVRRMLSGENVDTTPLRYDFDEDVQHVGLIASGAGAERLIASAAARLGLRALCVQREANLLWAWLGARRELPIRDIQARLEAEDGQGLSFAIGEPATGIEGWRATHELALHGARVAQAQGVSVTRCAEVLLEAALLASPALAQLLRERWLAPLDELIIGGEAARETLRAYFACERKVSCVAECLGKSRQTIDRRLALIEQALGGRLASCLAELELALRIEPLLNEGPIGEKLSSETS